jgi:hypothetical protein
MFGDAMKRIMAAAAFGHVKEIDLWIKLFELADAETPVFLYEVSTSDGVNETSNNEHPRLGVRTALVEIRFEHR